MAALEAAGGLPAALVSGRPPGGGGPICRPGKARIEGGRIPNEFDAAVGGAGRGLSRSEIHLFDFVLDVGSGQDAARLETLSPAERTQVASFRFARDRHLFLTRRALRRHLLSGYLGAGAPAIVFRQDRWGKPRLSGRFAHRDLSFNTSGAADHYVIAVRQGGPIGVDVVADQMADMEAMVDHVLTVAERREWAPWPPGRRQRALRRAWARKEALLKADGRGLQIGPSNLHVGWIPAGESRTVGVQLSPARRTHWTLLDLELPPAALAAICVPGVGELQINPPGRRPLGALAPPFQGIAGAATTIRWRAMPPAP